MIASLQPATPACADSDETPVLELDLVTSQPLPWPRVEELARLVEPVKDRVCLNGYDWNMRRMLGVDATPPVVYDLFPYLDGVPEGDPEEAALSALGLSRGVYGYLDPHPLTRQRLTTMGDYL